MKVFLSLLLLTALLSFHLAGAEAAEDGTGAYSNMAAYNFFFKLLSRLICLHSIC